MAKLVEIIESSSVLFGECERERGGSRSAPSVSLVGSIESFAPRP